MNSSFSSSKQRLYSSNLRTQAKEIDSFLDLIEFPRLDASEGDTVWMPRFCGHCLHAIWSGTPAPVSSNPARLPTWRDSYLHSTIRIISEISNKYLWSFNGHTALSSEMPVCMKLEILEYLIKSKVQLGASHLVGPLSMIVKSIKVLTWNVLDWHHFKMYVYLFSITLRVCLGARGPSLGCYHCHSHSSFELQWLSVLTHF